MKPIFPSQHYDAPQNRHLLPDYAIAGHVHARAGLGSADPAPVSEEEAIRAVGSHPNTRAPLNEGNAFSRSFTSAQDQTLQQSRSFQSHDSSFIHTAPRERISSLPDREEMRPLVRQRRRSVPGTIQFMGTDSACASSSNQSETGNIPPALRDIASKGQELFWYILSEEVKAQEAVAPGSLSALTISPSPQRMEVLNERGRFGGRTLRQIAEAFSQSPQRARVREYAESVELQSLNYNSFSDLLFGLFQEGGVTQARVLVLFFFCADIALRAFREKLTKHFQQLVNWTSQYITERLSAWVLAHGGWAAVLQESVDQAYKVALASACFLSVVALTIVIWRHRQ